MIGWLGRRLEALRLRALLDRLDAPAAASRLLADDAHVAGALAGDGGRRSERAFGTSPPAGGVTDVSGAGSGQYDGRSRCAIAVAGNSDTHHQRQHEPLHRRKC